jgi:uncharacterized membrane protein
MVSNNAFQYLKRIATSVLIMVLITYGMYTENAWLQYGSIFIIIGLQMGYQILKNIRAGPLVNSNMEEAARSYRDKALFSVKESGVNIAKEGAKGGGGAGMGMSTMGLMFVPLLIFIGTGQVLGIFFPGIPSWQSYAVVLGIFFPGIPSWQSYAVGFLISMPFSLFLQARSGISKGLMVTPKSYHISRKGIVFDYSGRSYIIYFPLAKINVKKEGNHIEVEGKPSKTTVIPNRLKLFTKDINKLQKILIRYTE